MVAYLRTGFDALDALLGGQGLRRGSSVIIRGAPGTGKTTLALQIAKNALANERHAFVFVSVEEAPGVLLNQITQSFWDVDFEAFLGGRGAPWAVEDLTSYWDTVVRRAAYGQLVNDLVRTYLDREAEGAPGPPDPTVLREAMRAAVRALPPARLREAVRGKMLELELEQLLRRFWERIPAIWAGPVLVVVDSLNALINAARTRFREYSERQMLLAVLNSFKTWRSGRRGDLTAILIAEEGPGAPSAAASYVDDVVIRLRLERLTHPAPMTPERVSDWKQDLLLCQIVKGRGLPIQRRDCCYEFVREGRPEERGIRFYPTYAAQGLVSLFYENQPQWEVIQNLRAIDVPSSYPQVLVQEFTRSGLQREFSVRRHSQRIPPRHPMVLFNVDEYWVHSLARAGLLLPLPAGALRPFSLALRDGADPAGEGTGFLKELVAAKARFFRDASGSYLAVPEMANVGLLVYRKDLLRAAGREPPRTWEELESICDVLREEGRPHKVLLETQTYDTLLVTALEMSWGHGAFWRSRREGNSLRLEFVEGSRPADLVAALLRLQHLIHADRFVPGDSSVDPDYKAAGDWVFARHWYSTWVDVLTRTDREGRPMVCFPEETEFGVAPLPVSEAYRARQGAKVRHHSAWGEWYLALHKGSENVELGLDLINNLMTARKIAERALSGAALPTVEKFYETYGEDRCLGTDLTYNELRATFFQDARSRTEFEDYPRVARLLSGALHAVVTNPRADVVDLLGRVFREVDPRCTLPADVREQVRRLLPVDWQL
jgi:KaiC/GvpD/RAD55 family RecA-like ATPase